MTKSVSLSLYLPAVFAVFAAGAVVSSLSPSVPWTVSSAGVTAPVGDLPDVSIETASGARTTLAATNGHVRIATMFYGHCPGVCPMTLATLRRIDAGLSERQRSRLNFVLLSLDPARDSPEELRRLAAGSRWLVGRTSADAARAFASAAHIQYRTLSDGSIDHSTSLVLLNEQGRLLARSSDIDDVAEFVAVLRRELDRSAAWATL